MQNNFRQRFQRVLLFLALGFVALFVFRIAYGFQQYSGSSSGFETLTNSFDRWTSSDNLQKNYASKKFQRQSSPGTPVAAVNVDQKYEKIATITSRTSRFEEEEKTVRKTIEQFNGIIQLEKNAGNKGSRLLHLLIGIQPDQFETFYKELLKVGDIQQKDISQTDKTNEYKELNAKKASLLSIRNSLIELKTKGGKIEEFIGLENRILEIEEQLQGLGVQLGNFDEENEFCTVRFSLSEGIVASISLMHRIKVALQWTIEWYLQAMLLLFCMTGFAYLLLLAIEKLKILNRIVDRMQ